MKRHSFHSLRSGVFQDMGEHGLLHIASHYSATQDEVNDFCLAFPRTTENLQWGDDLCFKFGGKIFTIVSLDRPRLCFKCRPESFAELIEREDIHPAPYVGRYKWVMLDRLDALGWDESRELIRQSYEMVVAKAPGKKRVVSKRAHPKKAKRV